MEHTTHTTDGNYISFAIKWIRAGLTYRMSHTRHKYRFTVACIWIEPSSLPLRWKSNERYSNRSSNTKMKISSNLYKDRAPPRLSSNVWKKVTWMENGKHTDIHNRDDSGARFPIATTQNSDKYKIMLDAIWISWIFRERTRTNLFTRRVHTNPMELMNNFLATKSKLHYAIKRSTTKSFPHLLHTRTHTRTHTLQFYHEEEIFDFCSPQYTAIQMCLDECVHVEVAAMNSIFVLSRSIDYKQNTYVLAHVLCILCFDVCSLLFQFPIHSITFLLSGVVVAVITLVVVNFPILVCYFRRYIRVSRRVQFFSPKSSTHATTHRLTLTHTERDNRPLQFD